jgi:hypothetical protein
MLSVLTLRPVGEAASLESNINTKEFASQWEQRNLPPRSDGPLRRRRGAGQTITNAITDETYTLLFTGLIGGLI